MTMAKPRPEVGQWWRFDREEGRVAHLYPGGGGGMGIATFDGDNIPPAHVCIMLQFPAWQPIAGPSKPTLAPPCTCRTLDGGVILSNGCALHDAAAHDAKTPPPARPEPPPRRNRSRLVGAERFRADAHATLTRRP